MSSSMDSSPRTPRSYGMTAILSAARRKYSALSPSVGGLDITKSQPASAAHAARVSPSSNEALMMPKPTGTRPPTWPDTTSMIRLRSCIVSTSYSPILPAATSEVAPPSNHVVDDAAQALLVHVPLLVEGGHYQAVDAFQVYHVRLHLPNYLLCTARFRPDCGRTLPDLPSAPPLLGREEIISEGHPQTPGKRALPLCTPRYLAAC